MLIIYELQVCPINISFHFCKKKKLTVLFIPQVGQEQGGFFGIMEHAMSRATSHIWFNRNEVRDRLAVANRLKEHIADENKLPILIFPEGKGSYP